MLVFKVFRYWLRIITSCAAVVLESEVDFEQIIRIWNKEVESI